MKSVSVKIQSDVTIPWERGATRKLLLAVKPGDSFRVPEGISLAAIHNMANRNGMKVRQEKRREGNWSGHRIFRVK